MKKIIVSLVACAFFVQANAQDISSFFTKTDAFLKKNVSNGKVDYQSIKNDPSSLNDILEIASKIDVSKENENNGKAFWINAYNVTLIKAIVNKYPVKSPLDIAGLFDKGTYLVAGKKLTLNDIENKMIRAKYYDARVHFVLVCGATGCPPIINAAYLPDTLEEQLNKQTKLALNNSNFIKVTTKKVELSQIFEWYKDDFGKNTLDFINKYRTEKLDTKTKYTYYTYDWTLNKK